MLELQNITKKFENNVAVNNISFRVERGKIFGIVGRNGAGKSTTFRMILNILEPTEGSCLYDGKKIDSNVLDRIGYLPEEGSLIPTYTVVELCEYYGSLKLLNEEEIKENLIKWLEEFNILEYMNKKIKDSIKYLKFAADNENINDISLYASHFVGHALYDDSVGEHSMAKNYLSKSAYKLKDPDDYK